MGDLRRPIVGEAEDRPATSPPSSSNPCPSSIGAERWDRAEETAQKIICRVQPTAVSEERRKEVTDYVQRLVRGRIGCQVFPFGSIPLKTYLPDGDIDLTAIGGASIEDTLVNDVVSVLEAEDKNRAAEFVVKDVRLIWAEVNLVKCIAQNIVVDISFNQLGGLCTLCFLEQVDRLIGKDHLFKRSIILIKAWCYYESRILGAHHGLISTYALETLVLYIFHHFYSTLNGPLAVLYRFLDYFSKFDWDNYCISLTGPVRISSFPEIVAEKPATVGNDLLLKNDFLKYCADEFSVPSRGADINSQMFPQKHLNIIDPLKGSNNLGRSVRNFYRIRSAFTYGAQKQKLGQILLQPEDNIAGELLQFFSNTLDRHGTGQRPDIQDPVSMSGHNGFVPTLSGREEKAISDLKSASSVGINGVCKLDPDVLSRNGGNDIKVAQTMNGHLKGAAKVVNSTLLLETDGSVNKAAVVEYCFSGDTEDLATSRIRSLNISNDTPKVFHPIGKEGMPQLAIPHFSSHLYFSGSVSGNGKLGCCNSDANSGLTGDKVASGILPVPDEETDICVRHRDEENISDGNHEVLTTVGLKDVASATNPVACSTASCSPGYPGKTSLDGVGSPEYLSSLSDLVGDYDSHLTNLHYARWYHEQSTMPALPSLFPSNSSWDIILHSNHFKQNGFSNMNANGIIPRPTFDHMNALLIPGATFGVEKMPKPRGTGTYFPKVNRPPSQKPLTGKGRNQGPVRPTRNNGQAAIPMEAKLQDRSSYVLYQGNGKAGDSDFSEAGSPGGKVHPDINGLPLCHEGVVEFGSVRHIPLGVPLPESSRQLNHASLLAQTSIQSLPTPGMQKS